MRAAIEHIPRPGGTAVSAGSRVDRRYAFNWHYHPEYELTLIVAGHGRRSVGDHLEDYCAPDLVLIGPRLPHTWEALPFVGEHRAAGEHRALVAHFATLPGLDAAEFASVRALLARAAAGLHFSPRVAAAAVKPFARLIGLSSAGRLTGLYDLLGVLARDRDARPLSSAGFAPALDLGAAKRIDVVCRWLSAHARDATVARAAAIAGLSPAAFSRFFRRCTGRTCAAWLQELRLGRACDQLARSDRAITLIAAESGFRSMTNFNRCFRRRRGTTPRAWRSRFGGD